MNSSNFSKTAWKTINELDKTKDKNRYKDIKTNINITTEEDPKKVADLFNEFFTNIPKKITNSLPKPQFDCCLDNINKSSIFVNRIEKYELLEIVKNKLKPKYSTGYDNVPTVLIRKSFKYFLDPLLFIINISLKLGKFPTILKISKVIPVFKQGDSENLNNYRPVTLNSCFSKIFEYCFISRLEPFLIK